MKFRAIAVAAERSNAIGTLELECTPHGLVITYLGVGAFSDGYAPGALTMGTRVTVPWSRIDEARVEGEQVYLAMEPSVTPHSRLTLVNFSTGDGVHDREVHRQRLILRIGAIAAALLAILVPALSVPRIAPHAGAGAALTIGALASLAILVVGFAADRHVALGGRDGEAARNAFAGELSIYLPHVSRSASAPEPKPEPFRLPSFDKLLPRTTFAIVATLTAGALGAVLTAHWVLAGGRRAGAPVADLRPPRALDTPDAPRAAEPRPAAATHAPAPKPASTVPPPAPAGDVAATGGACRCARADSLLWNKPIPKLSTLILGRRFEHDGNHEKLALDVAAVNNSDHDMKDVTLMVQFFERDPPPSNKRYPVSSRALYFEGPLGPGQAIKWSTEARGREFEISMDDPGTLGPEGQGAAPTNLIADLLNANHRPVRLHGAMLLAYLGDARAREAALKLREALREDEAPYLARLVSALADVRACNLGVSSGTVSMCLFNASKEAKTDLGISVRGLDGDVDASDPVGRPPMVLVEHTWHVPGQLAADSGVMTSARLDLGGQTPATYEVAADRYDLLRQ